MLGFLINMSHLTSVKVFNLLLHMLHTNPSNDLRLDSLIASFLVSDDKVATVSVLAFQNADHATCLAFP